MAIGKIAKATTIKDFKLQQCVLQRLSAVPFPKHMIKAANRKPEQYIINLEPTSTGESNPQGPVTAATAPEPPHKDEPPPKGEPQPKGEPGKGEPQPRGEPGKEEPPKEEPPPPPPKEEPKEEHPESEGEG